MHADDPLAALGGGAAHRKALAGPLNQLQPEVLGAEPPVVEVYGFAWGARELEEGLIDFAAADRGVAPVGLGVGLLQERRPQLRGGGLREEEGGLRAFAAGQLGIDRNRSPVSVQKQLEAE